MLFQRLERVSLSSGRMKKSQDHEVILAQIRGSSYEFSESPKFQPSFYINNVKNLSFQESKTAYLHCSIHHLGKNTVTWVRKRDLHLLTADKDIFTIDPRFKCMHLENSDDWTLEIRDPREEDSGVYQCQVSTEPKMILEIQLNIIVVEAFIPEAPVLSIKSDNPVHLTCHVKDPEGTVFLFWYHNGAVLDAYEKELRGIEVDTEFGITSISRLFIAKAKLSDSGNYSCQPSYSKPANVTLYVLNGK
ncbi:uncharacterized protein TNIN_494961 [Trichonephila inaurata madagascariensis]|uniref:Ig-like domain-containing protein n=1 Tax=Trichonephila inaurata madagascariensis TaxID=2747483 RepID=A0A8X7BT70_9ARAC|nr:uncharacterized protein TNIN_494961 [Trichonephila inaurata madagascariensis]